jgi:uronate dehydrogenase
MTKVALSGANGNMGRILRSELSKRGVQLRSAGGRTPLVALFPGEDVMHGDLRDPDAVDRLLEGVDVLIHLAGTSVERPLPEIIENNLVALHQVYEGARRNGVRRIIFASSNHAFGMHSVHDRLRLDAPFRPDGLYGLSKVWGEAMARMYWDKHGIEGVSVRIGTAMGTPPENARQLSTWLGTEDMVDLMLRCIQTPDIGYLAVWGASNNDRSYWDNAGAERLSYEPRQNAEVFAAAVLAQPNPLDPIARQYQGGQFVTIDFTPVENRRGKSATDTMAIEAN